MARYRKNKSDGLDGIVAALFGLLIMISLSSPKFREQLIFFCTAIIVISLLITGVIYFLYGRIRYQEPTEQLYSPTFSPTSQFGELPLSESLLVLPHCKIEWDKTILASIEWKRFEIVCREFFRMTGFDPRETKIGADGGVDIKLYKIGSETLGKPDIIVQCKAWNTYNVGVKVARELFGIMAAEKVERGMIITSGEFTSEAMEFAEDKELVLTSGTSFLQQIRELPAEKQQWLLDIALKGDYKTPTCPQCDIKMKLREGRSGKNPGSKFWGCVRYPRCRQTLIYKED